MFRSAPPLGCGTFHRFGRIFCNLLRRLSLAYRQVSGVPHGAKSLQNLSPKATWFYLTNLTFPIFRYRVPSQYSPFTGRALAHRSRSFSVPRSLCGAVQITALSGSFGHFCVSRNARVTGFALRGHQVIYAKSPTAHIRYSLVPSQYSPSTGQALAHRSRSRKGQSPKSAVIRGLHNNMPPTTSAHNPFATNLHRVARLKLLGCVYLIDSLPAALDKLFIFSFKISVIFVKLLRHIFQILHERALKCFACEVAHMV